MRTVLLSLFLALSSFCVEERHIRYKNCDLLDATTVQMFFVSACKAANFKGMDISYDTIESGYMISVWNVTYCSSCTLDVHTHSNICLVSFYSQPADNISYLQFKQNIDMFLGNDSQEVDWIEGQCCH